MLISVVQPIELPIRHLIRAESAIVQLFQHVQIIGPQTMGASE
jgi:hypothetical protein